MRERVARARAHASHLLSKPANVRLIARDTKLWCSSWNDARAHDGVVRTVHDQVTDQGQRLLEREHRGIRGGRQDVAAFESEEKGCVD